MLCRWVEAAWRSAQHLQISCAEVLALGPLSVTEALILNDAPQEVGVAVRRAAGSVPALQMCPGRQRQ